jgi:hypothetical protein
VSLRILRRRRPEPVADVEDPVVRQYRFLLRTAPIDALVAAHAEALPRLDPMFRAALLRVAQEAGAAAPGLTLDETATLAQVLAAGERRSPGALLLGYDDASRQRLSQAAVTSNAAEDLFGGYDDWDGAEAEIAVAEPVTSR